MAVLTHVRATCACGVVAAASDALAVKHGVHHHVCTAAGALGVGGVGGGRGGLKVARPGQVHQAGQAFKAAQLRRRPIVSACKPALLKAPQCSVHRILYPIIRLIIG
eukprot:1156785-Pelagomonas_calceolata.AAC.4